MSSSIGMLIEPTDQKQSEKAFEPDEEYIEMDVKSNEKNKIIWLYAIMQLTIHVLGFYGLLLLFGSTKWQTMVFTFVLFKFAGLGVTAGAHRLWSHKSYKATKPLKILLLIANLLIYHMSVIDWARFHRIHHKYSDKDADPHNASRGFFFSHMGWTFVEANKAVKQKLKEVDIKDLHADPMLVFQKKYFAPMAFVVSIVIPTLIPVLFWSETMKNSFFVATALRIMLTLNSSCLVNSLAHMWGYKPYDKSMRAAESPLVSALAWGEGQHNYHHAFPWDYKTSELGIFKYNFTTNFLDLCGKIGWAYDFKTASDNVVRDRAIRTGDGTHAHAKNHRSE